jgi:hypothetical protein
MDSVDKVKWFRNRLADAKFERTPAEVADALACLYEDDPDLELKNVMSQLEALILEFQGKEG